MRQIIATVLLSGLVLTGCGSEDGGDADGAAASGSPANAPASAGSGAGAGGGPAAGGSGLKNRTAFLEALREIDPRLVADEGKALSVARGLCQELEEGANPVAVAAQASVRYSGKDLMVDVESSKQIVKALQKYACKG